MSVDQTSLTVEILGDSSSAVEAAGVSQASLDKLNTAIAGLTASFDAQNAVADANAAAHVKVGASATEAAAGVDRLGASAARTTGLADALTEHSLLMSRGFEAAGVEAGTAATRVAALGDTMGRFAAVNPAILGIVGALTALFGAFEAMKGFVQAGAEELVKSENAMAELKIAVEQNGGSWAAAEPKIKAWTDALAFSSGVISSQSLPALLNLVNAGQTLDGSMSEVTIAADIAAAGMGRMARGGDDGNSSMRRFNQAIMALNEAMSGHVTRLEMIDGRLTPLIAKHASLHEILAQLLTDTQNAISKNDSLAMTYERLHGEVSIAGEAFAKGFEPAAKETVNILAVMADATGHVAGAFSEMVNGILQNIRGLIAGLAAGGSALKDFATFHFGNISGELGKMRSAAAGAEHGLGTAVQGIKKAVYDAFHPATIYANDLTEAIKRTAEQAASGIQDVRSFAPGAKAKSSGGAGAVPGASAYEEDTAQYKLQAQAERDLANTTDALTAAKQKAEVTEAQLAANVKLATTSQLEAAATQTLNAARTADAHQQVVLLTTAISEERGKQSELAQTVANLTQTLNADKAAQAAHTLELAGAHKESLDTREATSQYAAAVHDAKAQLDDAKAALKAYSDAIKAHNTELATAIAHYMEFENATNEALAKIQRDWGDFQQKQAQAETDSYAKRTMTAQQYVAFLATQYASDYAKYVYWLQQKNDYWAGVYEAQAKSDEQKLNEEENQIYQQNYQNFKNVDR